MIYKKKELFNIIDNILKENDIFIDIEKKEYSGKNIILKLNIKNNKTKHIIGIYEIIYDFSNNTVDIKMIRTNKTIINLPTYIALYMNPIKENFKIINTQKGGTNEKKNYDDDSSIPGLKKAHRVIKEQNLFNVMKQIKTTFSKDINKLKLLDLGSGKGNDLTQWIELKISRVIGFDINEESIKIAKHRYNEYDNKRKANITVKYYQSNVGTADVNLKHKLDKEIKTGKFHVISCNFMIHYLFESEETLNNLFKIISAYLIKDGFFIGTALNKNFVLKTYDDLRIHSNNHLLEIIPMNNFFDNNKIYGRKYSIRLGDKNDNASYCGKEPSIEYLVDFNELKRVASIHGLKLVDYNDFKKLYFNLVNRNKIKLKMTKEEQQASFLNCTFAFKKIT